MLPHAVLSSLGLSANDIDDLEKDESARNLTRTRDLIMSLYLRTIHAERRVEELWDKIEYIQRQVGVMFACGLGLGSLLTVAWVILWH